MAQLQPYLDQLKTFYKRYDEYEEYKEIETRFSEYLATWLRTGLIKDRDGLSLQMSESCKLFFEHLEFFKTKIKPSSHPFLMTGNKYEVILNAIYMSKMNDNRECDK